MSLEVFSRDVIPILQLVIGAIGLVSLFLLWSQLRQTNKWNKLLGQQNFLQHATMDLETDLLKAAHRAGVNLKARTDPLAQSEVTALWDDEEAYHLVMKFLSEFETTCLSIKAGIVDDDVAFSAHAGRVITAFQVYEPFVAKVRETFADDQMLVEFERVAREWCERDRRRSEDVRQIREKARLKEERRTALKARA